MSKINKIKVGNTHYDIQDNTSGYATTSYVNNYHDVTKADKSELNNYKDIYYGTCSTSANVSEKVITTDDDFELRKGVIIIYKPTVNNTATNVKLNVNGTGAKQIWYNNAVYTDSNTQITGSYNRIIYYIFDGMYWFWLGHGRDTDSVTSSETTIEAGVSDTKFATRQSVRNYVDNHHDSTKQDKLVSGTNIKTINNQSLLGSGNITIQGGGGVNSKDIYYGTCSTSANVSEKVITTDDDFELRKGVIIIYKPTVNNTATNVKLNVNGTGAKQIWYNNAVSTTSSIMVTGYANRPVYYIYDGTYWVWIGSSADIDSVTSSETTIEAGVSDTKFATRQSVRNYVDNHSKTGFEILINTTYHYCSVYYVIVGDYKICTLYYNYQQPWNVPTGETSTGYTVPENFRPNSLIRIPTAVSILILGTNGQISVYNGTGSTINNHKPNGTFTYIVPNNAV